MPIERVPVGVSSCLLGNPVRYDGAHKRDATVNDILADYFDFHPFCPEVGIGLGVPRLPIRLKTTGVGTRVVGARRENRGLDVTEALRAYSVAREPEVARLSGFIFKKGSPSCGTAAVPVFNERGAVEASGAGLFAAAVMARFPALPVAEEGHLAERRSMEDFVQRVFVYHYWRTRVAVAPTAQALAAFHAGLEPCLSGLDSDSIRRLEDLLTAARHGAGDVARLADDYIAELMAGLRQPTVLRDTLEWLSRV